MARMVPSHVGGAGVLISSPHFPLMSISKSLGAVCASFIAEIEAAIIAFEKLPSLPRGSTVLWATDSHSTLDALDGNLGKASDQVIRLWSTIRRHLHKGLIIKALWVPAHCGIPENEKADRLAAAGAKGPPEEHARAPLTFETIKTFTRKRQPSKLLCMDDIDTEKKIPITARKAEVILNQLRADCCPLVRTFRTKEEYNPICQACSLQVPETVEHLLRRCPGRAPQRRIHLGPVSRNTVEELCTKYSEHV